MGRLLRSTWFRGLRRGELRSKRGSQPLIDYKYKR
nr:MAG TPA_asm: hypothetical protein [Caudoviricetes sp.]